MRFVILNEMAKGTTYDPFTSKVNQERAKRDAINLALRSKASVDRRKERIKGTPVGDLKFYFLRPGDLVKTLMTVDEILQEEGGMEFILSKADAGLKSNTAGMECMTDLMRHAIKRQQESFA